MVNPGDAYPGREAAEVKRAELRGPIGRVVCIDERTGRSLIVTGFNAYGDPTVNFAPIHPANVIIPYDQ